MKFFRLFLFGLLISCAGVSVSYGAPTQDDLRRIEDQLRKERKTQQEAERKSSQLAGEIKNVQKQMVRSAKAVQEKEDLLEKLKNQLEDLQKQEEELKKNLALSDKQMVEVVTALQTLALRPNEVVLLEPQSPIMHLRSRMMLNYALPVVKTMNAQFLKDLSDLSETKSKIEEQANKVKTTQAQLNERTSQMNKLIRQKTLLQAQYDATHKKSKKRVVALANQAKDLKELLEKLEAEKKRRAAEEARRKAKAEAEAKKKQAQNQYEVTPAPKSVSRLPKGSFKKAKGSLSYPVRGRIVENFNDITSAGLHAKGITIETSGGNTVINPYHGTVLFAGPFKSYGQLLIMDNGGDYLTLLAGMEDINVSEGQEILAGEPVGRLKSGKGRLYMEIRKDGQAINPKPWFAKR